MPTVKMKEGKTNLYRAQQLGGKPNYLEENQEYEFSQEYCAYLISKGYAENVQEAEAVEVNSEENSETGEKNKGPQKEETAKNVGPEEDKENPKRKPGQRARQKRKPGQRARQK